MEKLHTTFWATKDPTRAFIKHKVKRDWTCEREIKVPEEVTVLGLDLGEGQDPLCDMLQVFGISGVFVRNEYSNVLNDILLLLRGWDNPEGGEKVDDNMDVDMDDMDDDTGRGEKAGTNIEENAHPESVANPFDLYTHQTSGIRGVSLTGAPGVGEDSACI